jgi:hypothetical protein
LSDQQLVRFIDYPVAECDPNADDRYAARRPRWRKGTASATEQECQPAKLDSMQQFIAYSY